MTKGRGRKTKKFLQYYGEEFVEEHNRRKRARVLDPRPRVSQQSF